MMKFSAVMNIYSTLKTHSWKPTVSIDLLPQNMPFLVYCSVIMELGSVNTSPLPSGEVLSVVIVQGGNPEGKGASLPYSSVPHLPDSCLVQFPRYLAPVWGGCTRSQVLKLNVTHSSQRFLENPVWGLQSRVLPARHRSTNSLSHSSLGCLYWGRVPAYGWLSLASQRTYFQQVLPAWHLSYFLQSSELQPCPLQWSLFLSLVWGGLFFGCSVTAGGIVGAPATWCFNSY